ncbi:hypothetical protein Trydic_g13913 [Trypoxylus dichotomus]
MKIEEIHGKLRGPKKTPRFPQQVPGWKILEEDRPKKEVQEPTTNSLNIIQQLLEQDNKSPDLAPVIDKCLTSNYFVFQGKFFEQIPGAAMGSPLSSVPFESVVLEDSYLKPKAWFRYVDDTFIIWLHGRDILDSFYGHLNSQHPAWKLRRTE